MTGRGAKTLPAELKRITHSEVLDIPKDLLAPIIEASKKAEDRPEIMKHIRECLAEPSGKQWKRIYGGLVLVDALVKDGPPALIAETAEGRYFDLAQRLAFLESFDNVDKRVQNNIRRKAEDIRKVLVPLIEDAALKGTEDVEDTASTCSPDTESTTPSTTTNSSMGYGSDNVPNFEAAGPAKRTMILNNIVAVGHSDDTTSESEGEGGKNAPVRYREPRRMTAKARNQRSTSGNGNSSDSDDASRDPEPPSKPTAKSMDLLGL